jgi:hypothetical protein
MRAAAVTATAAAAEAAAAFELLKAPQLPALQEQVGARWATPCLRRPL